MMYDFEGVSSSGSVASSGNPRTKRGMPVGWSGLERRAATCARESGSSCQSTGRMRPESRRFSTQRVTGVLEPDTAIYREESEGETHGACCIRMCRVSGDAWGRPSTR